VGFHRASSFLTQALSEIRFLFMWPRRCGATISPHGFGENPCGARNSDCGVVEGASDNRAARTALTFHRVLHGGRRPYQQLGYSCGGVAVHSGGGRRGNSIERRRAAGQQFAGAAGGRAQVRRVVGGNPENRRLRPPSHRCRNLPTSDRCGPPYSNGQEPARLVRTPRTTEPRKIRPSVQLPDFTRPCCDTHREAKIGRMGHLGGVRESGRRHFFWKVPDMIDRRLSPPP